MTSTEHPWRRVSGDRPDERGDLVASPPVLWPVATSAKSAARGRPATAPAGRAAVRARGRVVGAAGRGVPTGRARQRSAGRLRGRGRAAAADAGGARSGHGFDPPVVSPRLPATAAEEQLEPGMVLAVTGYVWEPGVGAVLTGKRSSSPPTDRSTDLEPRTSGLKE